MKRTKSGGILQIDFRNAFNLVKRSRLLGSLKNLMPDIMLFASFWYPKHSESFLNSSTVDSQAGVQQGDLLGAFLFSLAIWLLIDKIESKLPNLSHNCWYLNDGIIAGTEIELNITLEIPSEAGAKFDLEIRKDKCELWSIGSKTKVDSLIKRNYVVGIEFLGAAMGSDTFISSCLLERAEKLEDLLNNLAYTDDPQGALGIFRFCFGAPKMVYSLLCKSLNATFEGTLGVSM